MDSRNDLTFIWDMRNRLIHDYVGVDYDIVWKTVSKDIPELKLVVEEILVAG